MIEGMEHAAIASPDPARLAQWYANYLGFLIESQPPASGSYFIKAKDGSRIEILLSEGESRPGGFVREPGLRHLALITGDFDADYAVVQSSGAELLTGAEIRGGNRVVFFRDPDGNILHLIQRPIPLPR